MTTESAPAGPGALEGVRRALVVGLGASGQAAARALHAAGIAVAVVDDRTDHPDADLLRADGVDVRLGVAPVDALDEVDLLVPSPGVPEHAPVVVAATRAGLPVWSEPELGLRLHPRRLVAVTGTNGKTTTTELLVRLLVAGGVDARPCGNIGDPVASVAAASPDDAVLVAELSSFQLRFSHALRPEVGLLLNLAADHLDWHTTFDAYGAAKARIWRAQRPGDWAGVNAQDPATLDLAERFAPADVAVFDGDRPVTGPGVGLDGGWLVADLPTAQGQIVAAAELPLDAPHHRANVAAAAMGALLVGVDAATVADVVRAFHPGRHRLELVTERAGVRWVDDSKATNVHAAAAALRSADSIVWIAGGLAKGVDLGGLRDDLAGVRRAVLIGTAAAELAEVCTAAGVATELAPSIEDAVQAADRLARPGDTVLLAPACASFDQFSGYAERGERFAAAVQALGAPRVPTPGEGQHP